MGMSVIIITGRGTPWNLIVYEWLIIYWWITAFIERCKYFDLRAHRPTIWQNFTPKITSNSWSKFFLTKKFFFSKFSVNFFGQILVFLFSNLGTFDRIIWMIIKNKCSGLMSAKIVPFLTDFLSFVKFLPVGQLLVRSSSTSDILVSLWIIFFWKMSQEFSKNAIFWSTFGFWLKLRFLQDRFYLTEISNLESQLLLITHFLNMKFWSIIYYFDKQKNVG